MEKLQQEIERDIEKKKNQDDSQLEKAVALYSKMDAATAAQSITKLDRVIAVNILKQMKEKQASLVLASMGATESANLIAEMTTKNEIVNRETQIWEKKGLFPFQKRSCYNRIRL
ncbi:MAG: hypothetical protein Ct9H300mP28_04030 [Pseudomonadota bacterium]|nr:MAG: hypothetical protein Ct9H300mP28_04030 [Pseudomonadota bacterium]